MDWNRATPTLRTEDVLRERFERRDRLNNELRSLDCYLRNVRRERQLIDLVDDDDDDGDAERIAAAEEESVARHHSWRP